MQKFYDFIVIGSGFGGSISAMRLAEKGYSVAVIERGKRYEDSDFPKSNWNIGKYLWMPGLRCFGILQLSTFKDIWAFHGSGVGGGSLGYANVLMEPEERFFETKEWNRLIEWKQALEPHYRTARKMLGVVTNPGLFESDHIVKELAEELGTADTFRPTEVGVLFGENGDEGKPVPDPYFGGEGPARNYCNFCGGCLVGCRFNAKNSLMKNYLYFAEKLGVEIIPEYEVIDVIPAGGSSNDGSRYHLKCRKTTGLIRHKKREFRAKNVVYSAGTLGTLKLLFRSKEITKSLPAISDHLGEAVRSNSETLMGAISRNGRIDYSKGISITSIVHADEVTVIEPTRYPAGSSLLRFMSGPIIDREENVFKRIFTVLWSFIRHPIDFLRTYILPGWASRTTIIVFMQTKENRVGMKLGRDIFSFFRRDLVTIPDERKPIPRELNIGHVVTRKFAEKIEGIPAGAINESLFHIPITAHILSGCSFGETSEDGVIDLECRLHNYPGLYVVDGSIIPGNPGINPSLTISAFAEYAMSKIPPKQSES